MSNLDGSYLISQCTNTIFDRDIEIAPMQIIEIDVFQWRASAKSQESVHVEIINPLWEHAGWIMDNMVLPKTITISLNDKVAEVKICKLPFLRNK